VRQARHTPLAAVHARVTSPRAGRLRLFSGTWWIYRRTWLGVGSLLDFNQAWCNSASGLPLRMRIGRRSGDDCVGHTLVRRHENCPSNLGWLGCGITHGRQAPSACSVCLNLCLPISGLTNAGIHQSLSGLQGVFCLMSRLCRARNE